MATEYEFNRSLQNFQDIRSRIFSASSTNRRNSEHNGRSQFRQAAMTSIYKSIKENNISLILGGTKTGGFLPSLPKASDEAFDFIEVNEKQEISKKLGELQKKYNLLKDRANKNQSETTKLQKENEDLAAEEERLNELTHGIFKEEDKLRETTNQTQYLMEGAEWEKKSYLHMRNRLKRDKIAYQLKLQAVEQELEKVKKCYIQAEDHSASSKQYSENANKILTQMVKNVEFEFKARETKLEGFKTKYLLWDDKEQRKIGNSNREKVIAEHAIYDKDPLEKRLRQLLGVQKFVAGLLKSKMDREMSKFSIVEDSFSRIKQATGQTEMKSIVSKFLNREETYGELLGQIASHEKKIETIKRHNEMMETQLSNLKSELTTMEIQLTQKKSKGGNQERHDFLKKIDSVEESRKLAELMEEKLYLFSVRTLDKFSKVNQVKQDNKTHYQKSQLLEVFKKMHQTIMEELNQPTTEDVERVLQDLSALHIDSETHQEDYQKRNIRIKPRSPLTIPKQEKSQILSNSEDSSHASKGHSQNTSIADSDSGDSENEGIDEHAEIDYFDGLRDERKAEDQYILKKARQEREKEALKKLIPPVESQ